MGKKDLRRQWKLLKRKLRNEEQALAASQGPATVVKPYDILETAVEVTLTSEAMAVEKWISAHMAESFGLDLEWKPTFRKGARENPVALLQLSTLHHCILIQMQRLAAIPEGLRRLLAAPEVALAGVGICEDIRKLARDYGLLCCGAVELAGLAVEAYGRPELKQYGLKRLAQEVLQKVMDKNRKVSMSNWERDLEEKQISYAAADAWVSFALHQALKKKRRRVASRKGAKEDDSSGGAETEGAEGRRVVTRGEEKSREVDVNPHGAFLRERRQQARRRKLDAVGGKQPASESPETEVGILTNVELHLQSGSRGEPAGRPQHAVGQQGTEAADKDLAWNGDAAVPVLDEFKDTGACASGGATPLAGLASVVRLNGKCKNRSCARVAVCRLTAAQLARKRKKERHRKFGNKKATGSQVTI